VDQGLRALELVRWPLDVAGGMVAFRRPISGLISRIEELSMFGAKAKVRMADGLTPAEQQEADRRSLEKAASAAPKFDKAKIEELGRALDTVIAETATVAEQFALYPELKALRIAERARVQLALLGGEHYIGEVSVGHGFKGIGGRTTQLRVKHAADLALILVRALGRGGLSNAYEDWVKAAQGLRDEGVKVSVPAFTEAEFEDLATATGVNWTAY
jgi:hypothetical protein